GSVATTNALPGWTAYQGGAQVDSIVYNDLSLGAAWVSIQDTNSPFGGFFGGVIQGTYTVLLQPEFPGPTNATAAISQAGQIPATARSLRFYANGPLSVSFAGQGVPLFVLGTGTNYTIYGGDVTAFAGLTGDLRFEANA